MKTRISTLLYLLSLISVFGDVESILQTNSTHLVVSIAGVIHSREGVHLNVVITNGGAQGVAFAHKNPYSDLIFDLRDINGVGCELTDFGKQMLRDVGKNIIKGSNETSSIPSVIRSSHITSLLLSNSKAVLDPITHLDVVPSYVWNIDLKKCFTIPPGRYMLRISYDGLVRSPTIYAPELTFEVQSN